MVHTQVTAKDNEAQLANDGIVLYIADNHADHKDKLRIVQATVEWCKGPTRIGVARGSQYHHSSTSWMNSTTSPSPDGALQ